MKSCIRTPTARNLYASSRFTREERANQAAEMASFGKRTVVAILVVLLPAALAGSVPASCPPPNTDSVLVECTLEGTPVDCKSQPSAPGTFATFKCKPLYEFLFGYDPGSGYEAICGPDGEWSEQPFHCEPICGKPTGKAAEYVRNGAIVPSAADYPWHVTVYDMQRTEQMCGGSLIRPNFFLSAAHCFYDLFNFRLLATTRFRAAFARTRRDLGTDEVNTQYRGIVNIHTENYSGRESHHANDIALVELDKAVTITAWTIPVCVDWGHDLPGLIHGEMGTVVGFGNLHMNAHEELRVAHLPFVSRNECRQKIPDNLAVYLSLPDKYCAGYSRGRSNETVGEGDSGGGLSFPDKDHRWFLRGIVSAGSPNRNTYSFFTDVSRYLSWMSRIIREGEVSGRRCGILDKDFADSVVGAAQGAGGRGLRRSQVPWEVDIFYKKSSTRNFEAPRAGLLVKPNVVISTWQLTTGANELISLSEYPTNWLKVAYGSRRATDVSEVVNIVYPNEADIQSAGLDYNFILLKLKKSINLMPICMDVTGIIQRQSLGATFEVPQNAGGSPIFKRSTILNANECRKGEDLSFTWLFLSERNSHICTFRNGSETRAAPFSLTVNVDNAWFLRGVPVRNFKNDADGGSFLTYTDMSDPGVRRWLEKTHLLLKEASSKPSCGAVSLCQPLTPGRLLHGHMPWTVAVVVVNMDGTNTTMGSGVLVQPNAVLTDSSFVMEPIKSGQDWEEPPPLIPAQNVSVMWTADQDGSTQFSQVVRMTVSPAEYTEIRHNVVLLELDPSRTITNIPACLDLVGVVLPEMSDGQLGLMETWRDWGSEDHYLTGAAFMPWISCNRILYPPYGKGSSMEYPTEFCTTIQENAIDELALGGSFLVNVESHWYVQGLNVYLRSRTHNDYTLGFDFTRELLRNWLKKTLAELTLVESNLLEDTVRRDCEGGRPVSTECGLFVPQDADDELSETGGQPPYLRQPSFNHMQWTVDVHIDYEGAHLHHSGVVVHPKMVLTASAGLVLRNSTRDVVPATDVFVKYFSTLDANRLIAEVKRIHVKGWPEEFDSQGPALLELRTAVALTPVCIPAPGLVGNGMAPLAPRTTTGLVEGWDELGPSVFQGRLVPTQLDRHCENASLATGVRFCGQFLASDKERKIRTGAAFAVHTSDRWYVRGVLEGGDHGEGTMPRTAFFFNLDEPNTVAWLATKVEAVNGGGHLQIPPLLSEDEEDEEDKENEEDEEDKENEEDEEDGSEITTDGPETATDEPETATDGPETATDGSETATDGSETATDEPETATDGPETATDEPETATDGPETATDGSETAPAGPERTTSANRSDQTAVSWAALSTLLLSAMLALLLM